VHAAALLVQIFKRKKKIKKEKEKLCWCRVTIALFLMSCSRHHSQAMILQGS
jgi:hypothetical protein